MIEQGLNLAVDAVKGNDLVEEIGEEGFRNGDVKSNDRSKKLNMDEEYGEMIKLISKIKLLEGC